MEEVIHKVILGLFEGAGYILFGFSTVFSHSLFVDAVFIILTL